MEDKRKKVFFVNASMSSGGAERVISIIANKLVDSGFEICILTWLSAPVFYEIDQRIKLIDIEKECRSGKLIRKMKWFRRFIRNEKPDLILSFLAIFNIVTLFSLIGVKKKIVVCERNDPRYTPFGSFFRAQRNIIYHIADGVFTQTDSNKNYFSKRLQRKVMVIYNPIYLKDSFVGSAIYEPKQKTIVSIGRLETQKNQKMLIRSFYDFSNTHPDYKLIIYGEGSLRSELESYIAKLNLKERVILPGVVKNVFDCLKQSEIFVLSSYFEGMPNTLLEAMCLGVPCIATKVSGAVDLIEDGKNGYLVDIDDCDKLAKRMGLLADNIDLRRDVGKQASRLYDVLNVDIISKRWIACINKYIS